MKKLFSLLLLVLSLFLTACSAGGESSGETESSSDNLQVVASFYPMYEFAQQVGGDAADVTLMISAGNNVHGYEPSAQDLATLESSDVFVYANPEMETWVPAVLESVNTDNLAVVETDQAIELIDTGAAHSHEEGAHSHDHAEEEAHTHNHDEEGEHDHTHDHGEEGHVHTVDPHTWIDPANAITQVTEIKDAFVEADPDNAETYESNAADYIAQLEDLQAEYDEALSNVSQTDFITQHAAFGYLAHRYDLTQHYLTGISADEEASPQRMAEIVSLIEETGMPVVYYNVNENSDLAETVAAEAGVETAPLHTLETLSEDEMAQGANYISVMQDNLEALTLAIQ